MKRSCERTVSMSSSSNLEVVDEPDLLLATIGAETNSAAAEDKIGKLDEVSVLIDEKPDALPV